MIQSTFQESEPSPFHVAMIMDGNGRWATARGLSRAEGHREGAKAVRRTVEAAPGFGITTLTLYAFSCDNWQRPPSEVNHLMRLFYEYLQSERDRCIANGIRLTLIGRRDRLAPSLRGAVEAVEAATAGGKTMHLRLAVDYSARDSILSAATRLRPEMECSRQAFSRLLAEANHDGVSTPDVDLLIRTGGEKRLSDFLLWESAYAELVFTDCMWPEFGAAELQAAVEEFRRRERRFGAIPTAAG